tara:strand:- start:302 stop:502 length:201 start_codon:yes stop_codon:yes gene_type:complete
LFTPEIASGFFSNFSSKELNLEYREFNKIFKFDCQCKKAKKSRNNQKFDSCRATRARKTGQEKSYF